MCLDLRLPWKLLITHLSGKSSTIKPSMETTGTPSATSPDLCRELMRSSAPFSPAVKPTGWAAIVACPSCKQTSAEWSTLQRILPSSTLEPYKPFFCWLKFSTTTTTNWNPYMCIISSLCCLWICIYYLPYVFLYVHSFYVYMTYEMLNIPMPHVLQCPMYVFL